MNRIPVYLASASPARKRLLTEVGFAPIVIEHRTDEEEVVEMESRRLGRSLNPEETVSLLAEHKGQHLDMQISGVLITADTVLSLDGVAYGKPSTSADALYLLKKLRGREASFVTGQWVEYRRSESQRESLLSVTKSHLKVSASISDAELIAYVNTGEPQRFSGGLTTGYRSAPFIEEVYGDSTAMLGLSMSALRKSLASLQIPLTSLWGG